MMFIMILIEKKKKIEKKVKCKSTLTELGQIWKKSNSRNICATWPPFRESMNQLSSHHFHAIFSCLFLPKLFIIILKNCHQHFIQCCFAAVDNVFISTSLELLRRVIHKLSDAWIKFKLQAFIIATTWMKSERMFHGFLLVNWTINVNNRMTEYMHAFLNGGRIERWWLCVTGRYDRERERRESCWWISSNDQKKTKHENWTIVVACF